MGILLILVGVSLGIGTARAHQASGGQSGGGTFLAFMAAIGLIVWGLAKLAF